MKRRRKKPTMKMPTDSEAVFTMATRSGSEAYRQTPRFIPNSRPITPTITPKLRLAATYSLMAS